MNVQDNAESKINTAVQQGVAAQLEPQAIYDFVGVQVRDAIDPENMAIFTLDRKAKRLYCHYAYTRGRTDERQGASSKLPKGLIDYYDETKQPVLINQDMKHQVTKYGLYSGGFINQILDEDGNLRQGPDVDAILAGWTPSYKSLLYIPLIVSGKVKGCVGFEDHQRENAFSDVNVRRLQSLVNTLSETLEKAGLLNDKQHA